MRIERPERVGALHAFSFPAYRWFWLASFFSFGSVQMQQLARGFLARELTPEPFLVTAVFAAWSGPLLIAPLIGGAMADRMDRRKLLWLAEAANGLITMAFTAMLLADAMSIGVLIGFSVATGFVMGGVLPVRQAMIADMVAPNTMTNALVLFTAVFSGMMVTAPAAAGFIIDGAGAEAVFYTALAASALSLAALVRVPAGRAHVLQGASSLTKTLVEGMRFIRTSRRLLLAMVAVALMTTLAAPFQAMLPVFQRDVLDVGAAGLGWMYTMTGVGALVSSVLLAIFVAGMPRAWFMLGVGVALGLAVAAFAQSSSFPLALGMLAIVGLLQGTFLTLNMATVQFLAPAEMRGRVFAIRSIVWGLSMLGQLLVGGIASVTSPQTGLAVVGLMAAAAQVGMLLWLWTIRGPGAGRDAQPQRRPAG